MAFRHWGLHHAGTCPFLISLPSAGDGQSSVILTVFSLFSFSFSPLWSETLPCQSGSGQRCFKLLPSKVSFTRIDSNVCFCVKQEAFSPPAPMSTRSFVSLCPNTKMFPNLYHRWTWWTRPAASP